MQRFKQSCSPHEAMISNSAGGPQRKDINSMEHLLSQMKVSTALKEMPDKE